MANVMGKTRGKDAAYITTTDPQAPGWTWYVLKSYQQDGGKQYARAFCLVTSPMTGASGDLGDCYTADIGPVVQDFDRDVFESSAAAAEALWGKTGEPGMDPLADW